MERNIFLPLNHLTALTSHDNTIQAMLCMENMARINRQMFLYGFFFLSYSFDGFLFTRCDASVVYAITLCLRVSLSHEAVFHQNGSMAQDTSLNLS